jgi:prephenate dehydrogenase
VRDVYKRTNEVKEIFESKSIRTIQMTPDEHDRTAASSQGITHFIGRVLNESGVRSTNINTMGFNELLGVIEQTCNDSWDLFKDLQRYNSYTNGMIDNLVETIDKIHKQIKKDAH